ncbi:MAG: IPTL-CTERM sorting domain-containing protein [Deltaproteobacteria bacterium]|nr:IPTL-CTERM sorting domain-containing protein [Deltaproteobacteria bacterium]
MCKEKYRSLVIVVVFALSFVLVYGVLPVLSASTDKSVQPTGASDVLSNGASSEVNLTTMQINSTVTERREVVPTLNEWGAAILGLLMACAVVIVFRRHHRRS